MSWQHLGEVFDIHGGGIDLVFPHHENEIAQSRSAFGTPVMAKVWMHNGFLQVEGEKMAKSAGNFVTIHELLADWPGDVLRLNMLRTHYRQPIDWTLNGLETSLQLLEDFWRVAGSAVADAKPPEPVLAALLDDLNTPEAIAALHGLRKAEAAGALAGAIAFLGFGRDSFAAWRTADRARILQESDLDSGLIERLIAERAAARQRRDFAEADRIRQELEAKGIQLNDGRDPDSGELVTTWELKR
jgi:cysteinyl-tRNA synthetase